MSNVAQLKQKARSYEQREQWTSALETYEQLVQELPEGEDVEVGLWNRIGDLNMRVGRPQEAVTAYERAVDAYAGAGLHNNALALCNKILRITPERIDSYLKLGMISALKGFLADARQHLSRYVDLMHERDRLDEALDALVDGVGSHPDDDADVRRAVAEQLQAHGREATALELLQAAHGLLAQRGQAADAERVRIQIRALGAGDEGLDVGGGAAAADKARRGSLDDIQLGGGAWRGRSGEADRADADAAEASLLEREPEVADLDLTEIQTMDGLEAHLRAADADDAPAEAAVPDAFEPIEAGFAAEPPGDAVDADDDQPLDELDQHGQPRADRAVAPVHGFSDTLPLLEPRAGSDAADTDDAASDTGALELLGGGDWQAEAAAGDAAAGVDEDRDGAGQPDDSVPLLELTDWRGGDAHPARDAEADAPVAEYDAGWTAEETQVELRDTEPGEPAADDAAPEPVPVAEALANRLVDDPADFEAVDELTALLLAGEAGRHELAALDAAARALGERGAWREAIGVVRPLLAMEAAPMSLFQRQVELAHGADQADLLVRAYLDLAGHLERQGDPEKASAVYERVIELDPDSAAAREALGFPAESGRPEAADEGYIDLAALIMEDEPESTTTRFVVEAEPPSGDEDRDFAEILSRFREQVARNIAPDDAASHYDLGVAFKEMGLWDDAASEFQAALRAGADPLATLEVLGECFVAQQQYSVGWRVLERAVRVADAADGEMLGVLYWMARCDEALGRSAAAAELYERVLAVDIRFRDAADRLRATQAADPLPTL